MKRLVILGAGTGGTMMANHLYKKLEPEWKLTLLDQYPNHYYQPGFLFIPFGMYSEKDVVRPKRDFIPEGVEYVESTVDRIEPNTNQIRLESGATMSYDILIIATGSKSAPELTPGMLGEDWRKQIFDFYTIDGAIALHRALQDWNGGRLVIHLLELPVKCQVAPIEFTFLAEWWLTQHRLRERTELTYVTPLPRVSMKPSCSDTLEPVAKRKGITVVNGFKTERVDASHHSIVSEEGKTVPYDLLVTIPIHTGDQAIARSGFGNRRHFVPTDPRTLQSKVNENVFVLGDATDVMTSKAGSVAHFESEVLTRNILHYIHGEPLEQSYDGHANCYIESGYNKAIFVDFGYDRQPAPEKYPLPHLGPLSGLEETHANHLGKLALRWIYWNVLLRGRKTSF